MEEGGHIYKQHAYVQECSCSTDISACQHAMTCADTHTCTLPTHTHTHTHSSPDNTHTPTGLMVYSVWRASPVSVSLRYHVDSRGAGMSFISLTGTSLRDSDSQPSSTAARRSVGDTTIPPAARRGRASPGASVSLGYCGIVENC